MSSLSRSSSNPSNHNILTKYDAVIIGAGLGGLTSAALLANAGKQVLVLERNAFPGGAATTYQRGPLTIEASLHETTPPGSAGDPKRDLFEKIGLVGELEFVEIPWFQEVRWPGIGAPFRLPHGLEAVQTALHEHFPEAEKGSRLLIEQLHRTLQLPEFASPEHNLGWRLNHLAELPLGVWAAFKDVRSSLGDVFRRYFGDNEAIKFALSGNLMYYGDDPDKLWWMAYAMAQGSYMKWGGYYIRGGSQQLTNKLVEAIENAGGHVLVNCPATQIELDGAGVAAVRYRDKNSQVEHRIESDHLLANAAPQVVSDMLPEQVRSGFMAPYQQRELSISLLSVSLGLDRPPAEFGISSYSTVLVPAWMKQFSDYPKATELFSADPDGRLPVMCIVDYNQIDSGLPFAKDLDAERAEQPAHLFSMNIVCADRLSNWLNLTDVEYQRRRTLWLQALVDGLDAEWPGLAAAVKEKIIATARTMHEHLNTPEGAVYGFAMNAPEKLPREAPKRVHSSIDGLWIASAFSGFGGFTGAIGGGISAAKAVLKSER